MGDDVAGTSSYRRARLTTKSRERQQVVADRQEQFGRLFERREMLQTESSLLLSELESVDAAKTDVYRERMEKAVREYNELGIADLTRYVCHRRVIIDLLAKALSLQSGDGKYGREDAVHSLL